MKTQAWLLISLLPVTLSVKSQDCSSSYFPAKEGTKIEMTNYDKNGTTNYIGGNSFLEAAFAHVLNKKLYFLFDIPEMGYSDELRAMQPVILNGDLSKII